MSNDEIHEKKIEALAATLRKNIAGEVRFSDGDRALYATDGSNYRQPPIGIVIPKSEEDVITIITICRQFDVPILPRGGGTSLAGQCCNVAVVIDFSKYLNKILEITPGQKLARVQAGCILDNLKNAAQKHHLTFAPDPATHSHNTLGGMIGNNSCGTHSLMAVNEGRGLRTSDNIETLKILTYDGQMMQVGRTSEQQLENFIAQGGRTGEIYAKLKSLRDRYAPLIRERYPNIPRRVSGYNLDELLPEHGFHVARALVGSEGTCVTILEATTNLVYSPSIRILLVLGYPDVFSCGDDLLEILQYKPCALEGFDTLLIKDMKAKDLYTHYLHLLPPGGGWLLVEFDGDTLEEADHKAQQLMAAMNKKANPPSMKLYEEESVVKAMWKVRESGLGATAWIPGAADTWEGWEDAAVAPEKIGIYLRELHKLFKKYNYTSSTYGHFGQGCVHCRIPFDLKTHAGIKNFRSFLDEAADLVISLGGSLSGEHGDGQSRAELLPKMYGEELVNAFREFKTIWDPQWKMNPGKVVDPYPITSNLRLGVDYNPWNPETHFQFPQDKGSFARATLRCVGVGICRRESGGVMCPSFMVTKEEKYSTRGRAHLLFEMLEGKIIGKQGWRDQAVKESLDLCLSCKGCKSDCPVNVDMAKYKAEFLSHYHAGKLRPISAYAFGFIYFWARFASRSPKFINFLTQTPGFSHLAKVIVGIAQKRRIPRFAEQTFRDWFSHRAADDVHKEKVILWVDTFTNYFDPAIPIAATEVLEKLGFQVVIPFKDLCCGRPLYDFGFLKPAKKLLLNILNHLRTDIREGIPVIGLEPSCVATFRDEMTDLLPHDEDALRLKQQTFLFSEFLVKKNKLDEFPALMQRALVQIHCHHHAVMKMDAEEKVMKKLGLDFEILNSGCCGMAGSFGYESGEKYDVSVKAAEREMAPAIRKASADTLIIADGFSCRTQIYDQTKRKALHLVEVIKLAMDNPL